MERTDYLKLRYDIEQELSSGVGHDYVDIDSLVSSVMRLFLHSLSDGEVKRQRAKKSGKPYCMYEAFCHLPNIPYPQKASFYAELPNQVPPPGTYECDVIADVRDSRLSFDVDPRQGRRIQMQKTAS